MATRGVVTLILIAVFSPSLASGCSCSNGTPIQRTSEEYKDRAVFKARVVQLMGRTHGWDGARYSGQALAVVQERYWGVPRYWPRVVILDGGFFCGMVMADGEEYLVSGRRTRYGVVDVSGCSRTQPLKTAQLDLRTLDGSHCAGPGGTILGYVRKGNDRLQKNVPAAGSLVTLRDQDGKAYTAQSDRDGIYELQHLPAGTYRVESRVNGAQYASSSSIAVAEATCLETPILLRDYSFGGQLAPGLGRYVSLKLVRADGESHAVRSDSIEPDGKFYFRNVPDGEYLLTVTSWMQGVAGDLHFPGTYDRQRATRIRVNNHTLADVRRLDFSSDTLPLVPIPVALDPPNGSGRFLWRVQLLSSNSVINEENWIAGSQFVRLYGVRGASYNVALYGYSNHPIEYEDCRTDGTPVTAKDGLSVVHVVVPTECR